MWEIVKENDGTEFMELLALNPNLAHVRSKDGRGAMFWAHEFGRAEMIDVLKNLGVKEDLADANGIKPTDITHPSIKGKI